MYFISMRSYGMESRRVQTYSVSDFLAVLNQTLEFAYPLVSIEGEVASFKVNQGKYVFFDLKDESGTVGCFMTVWQLRTPIEDGMKVVVQAAPKVTPWGKFSLTVQAVRPSGEGSLKKSFELLKAKLEKEGLFDEARKRPLPAMPQRIAVISSTQAAGYADFIKIINTRWGGLSIEVAHTQVQGEGAADQMIRAIKHLTTREELADVLVLIRGGGSADDLAAYNDEKLVRAIAASRIPTLVGVGHEVDMVLADLVADVRAATPSNAAQLLVPDRREIIDSVWQRVRAMAQSAEMAMETLRRDTRHQLDTMAEGAMRAIENQLREVAQSQNTLHAYDPRRVLERGYALVRGDLQPSGMIEIETQSVIAKAEVRDVQQK